MATSDETTILPLRPPSSLSQIVRLPPSSPPNQDNGTLLMTRLQQQSQSPRLPRATAVSSTTIKEYLPHELMLTLRRQQQYADAEQSPQDTTHLPPVKGQQIVHPHASVWGHQKQRSRFKHFMNDPPCICGAGRDISFLYDAHENRDKNPARHPNGYSDKAQCNIPTSLIPGDYHIVKHPQVLGLEYHDDPYVTRPSNHDHHMTVFPSMKPSGRHEVLTLKHTMDQMLEKAGVEKHLDDSDLKGPTPMHNLLELVQKEQDIYNICFHELIRQVSVQCAERGELMAELRKRYSNLLDRIPHQVKSLHDEVLAQRALDKRLTSELNRFKHSVTTLTSELAELRDHEMIIAEDVTTAQENLISALAETEKNANLLAEYHDLYELQRKRLEDQHVWLSQEKELWLQACYSLALKVADQRSLQTLQRIQLSEKSWSKLASHFNIILSDKDTQQLSQLQGSMQLWKEKITDFVQKLNAMEQIMVQKLTSVEEALDQWIASLKSEDGEVKCLEIKETEELWKCLSDWQQVLNLQSEQFSGEILLQRQEELKAIKGVSSQWAELSLAVARRHYDGDNSKEDQEEEDTERKQEEERVSDNESKQKPGEEADEPMQHSVVNVNAHIDVFMEQLTTRTSGENGVAVGYVHMLTPMEKWDTKLNLAINSTEKRLSASDWSRLLGQMCKWVEQIKYIRKQFVSSSNSAHAYDSTTDKQTSIQILPLGELVSLADKWRSSFTHFVDSKDTLLANEVHKLHGSLVQWMVEMLLCLVADKKDLTMKEKEESRKHLKDNDTSQVVVTTIGEKPLLSSVTDLHATQPVLADALTTFSSRLSTSCKEIVQETVDFKKKKGIADAEEEMTELSRLTEETSEWVRLSHLLVNELLEEMRKEVEGIVKEESGLHVAVDEEKTKQKFLKMHPLSEAEEQVHLDTALELPENMNVLGVDGNVHQKSLQQAINETEMPPAQSAAQLGLSTEEVLPEGRGTLNKDAEALLIELDQAKQELNEQVSLTATAEEKASKMEKELKEANERIYKLESQLQKRTEEARQLSGRQRNNAKPAKHTKPTKADSKKKL